MDPPQLFISPIIPLFSPSLLQPSHPSPRVICRTAGRHQLQFFESCSSKRTGLKCHRWPSSLRFRAAQVETWLPEKAPAQGLIPCHPITALHPFPLNSPPPLRDERAPHLQGSTPTYLAFPTDSLCHFPSLLQPFLSSTYVDTIRDSIIYSPPISFTLHSFCIVEIAEAKRDILSVQLHLNQTQ